MIGSRWSSIPQEHRDTYFNGSDGCSVRPRAAPLHGVNGRRSRRQPHASAEGQEHQGFEGAAGRIPALKRR